MKNTRSLLVIFLLCSMLAAAGGCKVGPVNIGNDEPAATSPSRSGTTQATDGRKTETTKSSKTTKTARTEAARTSTTAAAGSANSNYQAARVVASKYRGGAKYDVLSYDPATSLYLVRVMAVTEPRVTFDVYVTVTPAGEWIIDDTTWDSSWGNSYHGVMIFDGWDWTMADDYADFDWGYYEGESYYDGSYYNPDYEDPGYYEDPYYEDPGYYVDPGYYDEAEYFEDPGYYAPY